MGMPTASDVFAVQELRDKGLLWLVNRVAFHPRGFALALVCEEDGTVSGCQLLGDGSEPHYFTPEDDEVQFRKVQTTLAEAERYAAEGKGDDGA